MSDWNEFLLSQGAVTDAYGTVDFPYEPYITETTYLVNLPQQGLIEVKGPDAAKFLQGQVTCDIRELEQPITRLGAQCNIKGRMLLYFRALQLTPEHILLRVHSGLVNSGLASLGKYIVFSKAKLADLSGNYCYFGITGPQATALIQTVFGATVDINSWKTCGNSLVIRLDDHRYECWVKPNEAQAFWVQLTPHTQSAGQNLWNLLNIQAGLGEICPETLDSFTPQAINLQLVNGINFRKGCYTGQEIVARLHYRGNLKRHMYRFDVDLHNQPLPAAGTELKNAEGKNVGEVIMAAYKTHHAGELLASVVDDELEELYLPDNPQKLSLLSLPYAIPTPNEADS